MKSIKRIVVVGGGAGGLELVTKLGRKLGKYSTEYDVTLIDVNLSHIWKPLLHEVATGVIDAGIDALSYRAQAKSNYFHFVRGKMVDLDRTNKRIILAPIYNDKGEQLAPERYVAYDIVVLAIGSVCNDFNTPGAKENCIFLDNFDDANHLRNELINQFIKLHNNPDYKTLDIAIVGGGATGVELSAEIHHAISEFHHYDLPDLSSSRLNINLIEASPRILGPLPEKLAQFAHDKLVDMGVHIHTGTRVTSIEKDGIVTIDGTKIPSKITVWAAGIKCPDYIKGLAGLETNRINQISVRPSLQSTIDDDVYVIGDLASCPQENGKFVPPRAQSAHQMADHVYKNLLLRFAGKEPKPYIYHDYGSLISLGEAPAVGVLIGKLFNGQMMIEGAKAHLIYVSLYRKHQMALYGIFKTSLIMLTGQINRAVRPKLKLH